MSTASALVKTVVLERIQWSTLDHVDAIDPINENDLAILEEIRDVIDRHGYHNRFGISLLHKHFDLNEGEVALEETDEVARISTIRVVPDDGDVSNRIGTMWRFKKGQNDPQSVTVCEKECDKFLGHKQRHKKVGR